MKIAIISDIHNNELNLKKVLDFCAEKKIEKIICCGDLASQETLDFLCDNFSSKNKFSDAQKDAEQTQNIAEESEKFTIYYTFGNMDVDHLNIEAYKHVSKYKNAFIYESFGETEIDGIKIAFVHFPNKAKELAETGKYDFVFFGHTHKPWQSEALAKDALGQNKKCILLNPGNVTGDLYPPTFAIWNTDNDKFELIRIHGLK